ncbi:MAG: hypothetical protein ACQESP_08725 [Candidatus Muiribacteriota bacterium]
MKKLIFVFVFFSIYLSILSFQNLSQEHDLSFFTGSSLDNHLYFDSRFETFKYSDDFYFNARVRFRGDKDDLDLSFDRAYMNYAEDKTSITLGRQRIYWGLSHVFNYTDIFNDIDVADPKKDRTGVDALRILYNETFFSRIELANEFKSGNDNFALRYTQFKDGWEYMINYLNYSRMGVDFQDYILEFQGNLKVGLWGQIISHQKPVTNNTYVLGLDYSYLLKNTTLYLISEFSFSEKADYYYFGANYSLSDYQSVDIGYTESDSDRLFFQAGTDYMIDDFKSFRVQYSRLYSGNSQLFPGLSSGHEIEVTYSISR